MAIISGLMATCSGLVHPKLPLQIQKYDRSMPGGYNAIQLVSKRDRRAKIHYFLRAGLHARYATSAGRNHQELSYGNDIHEEPFWLTLIKEALWASKSLFIFLLDQPSQLKYIEWPSFENTLKTATLTLFLVALLIVALTSVDSALGYLLALFLRKTP